MKKNKKKTIEDLAIHKKDTGSSEVQISFLTSKISYISEHFKKFKKDKHSSIGLLKAQNRRKFCAKYAT